MFCKNCGQEIPNNTKFCSHCGAAQDAASSPASQRHQKKGSKTGGIILVVLGALSVLGGFSNGSYANMMNNGFDLANLVTIGLQIALIVGGTSMIRKAANKQ